MPLTYSGRLVSGLNTEFGIIEAPSLVDIALGLSRAPRFAGQTRRWWTVLGHSFFVAEMAKRDGWSAEAQAALALHDAHEAVTADVPTDFKDDALRARQHLLDEVIYDLYFGRYGGWARRQAPEIVSLVKHYDRSALAAEAWLLGPPDAEKHTDAFGQPHGADLNTLEKLLEGRHWLTEPKVLATGAASYPVQQYIRLIAELM